ncbi:hypothetical protein PIB30_019714 [Stylosanthes scabra]|uniref:Shikimate dehydrogenase n=1 Tax=Stylosanthes scabra TaxID=79078 RepID=A0ABU6V8G2_9FABA|nr:hypothetical protein [Stylosanthes scabra]
MGSNEVSAEPLMICAPIRSQCVEQILKNMHQAKAQGADVVEISLDHITNFHPHNHLQTILTNKLLPILFSYRPKWEGGLYEGDENIRLEALQLAMELGADFIDIELKAFSCFKTIMEQKKKHSNHGKIIVSSYVDGVTPTTSELLNLVTLMQATGADMIKLVTNAEDITEIKRIFSILPYSKVPLIAYSVGDRGLISQLLCPKFGGFFVYGTLDGNPVPGMPPLETLQEAYKLEHVNEATKVFGLISKPVGHSKGPLLHNPTFRHAKFNGMYVPMFVDDLKEFFSTYTSDFAGYSVGFPYKEKVLSFCDEVHPLAQSIGAVNTIVRRPIDGKLVGYNTDCEGAITAIEDALIEHGCNDGGEVLSSPLARRLFVLVGAGGAGRALAFGAKSRGSRVVIFDIDFERAKSLASAVSGEAWHYKALASFEPEKGAILANATPIGMHPNIGDRISVAEASLKEYELVFDAVYTPRKTRLLKEADEVGAITVSGVEMFLRQARAQFNLFTGLQAPEHFMREIVLSKF